MTKEVVFIRSGDSRRDPSDPPPRGRWSRLLAKIKEGREIVTLCSALCLATYTAITSTVAYVHGLVTKADVDAAVTAAVASQFEKARLGELKGDVVNLKVSGGNAADQIVALQSKVAMLEGRYEAFRDTHPRKP